MREPQRPDLDEDRLRPWAGGAMEEALVQDATLEAVEGTVLYSRLVRVSMVGARLRSLGMSDVAASGLDAANADWTGAKLKRVELADCRMTGLTATELEAEDVVLRGCRLDFASFHRARIRRARFEDCDLSEADLSSASLQDVRLDRCRLIRTDIERVELARVDLRGSTLEDLRGELSALRGATIDAPQLVDLAPYLARALGIRVD